MFFHSLGLLSKVAVGLKNKPCLEVVLRFLSVAEYFKLSNAVQQQFGQADLAREAQGT